MKIIKNFILLVTVFSFFPLLTSGFTGQASAQDANFLVEVAEVANENTEQDPCANPMETETAFAGAEFSVKPAIECINESLDVVIVTFNNISLRSDDEVYICTGHKDCFNEENGTDRTKNLVEVEERPDANDNLTIEVCGDHEDKVKFGCRGVADDYFHGGNLYTFSIGVKEDDRFYPLKKAGFTVLRSYPKVTINPHQGIKTNSALTINISDGVRGGGETRNNYQIRMKGPGGYDEVICGHIDFDSSYTTPPFSNFRAGEYIITIRDQVKDTGFSLTDNRWGSAACKDAGGFTFFETTCTINNTGGECSGVNDRGEIIKKDPKGEEYIEFTKQLAILNGLGENILLPCSNTWGEQVKAKNISDCKKVNTALGPIDISITGFIESIFSFVLVIASFGAVVIIIYAGYTFMISRGDKEKVQAARDTITSAIVGLLFIVLSIVILEIIGVDILSIPGLSREPVPIP